jgi:hypothetical protein
MSFLSGLAHVVGNVAAPVSEAAGGVLSAGGLVPNKAANLFTNTGHAISNPSVTLNNAGALLTPGTGSFAAAPTPGPSYNFNSYPYASPLQQGNSATDSGSYIGGTGTAGGGGGGTSIDPNTGLSYDYLEQQANGQIGNLDQQYNVGNQNILDAYNTQYNQLQGNKALTDRNYTNTKAQTLQDYTTARGNNQAQVGQQANSLQRLLGSHGYQGSANIAANYAAARQGAQANGALEQGYGRNQQALDTNYGDFNNQFNTSLGDLSHQRDTQKNQLQASVDQTKQGLLQQLAQIAAARSGNPNAGAGLQPQIDSLGQQVTQLGRQYASPVIQATAPVYHAPTLESYATPQGPAPSVGANQAGAANNVSPFLSVLLGQDKKNQNLAGLAA